jgi:hypothetical protein
VFKVMYAPLIADAATPVSSYVGMAVVLTALTYEAIAKWKCPLGGERPPVSDAEGTDAPTDDGDSATSESLLSEDYQREASESGRLGGI